VSADQSLPPLPLHAGRMEWAGLRFGKPGFTADQMRDYARAAILQERERGEPPLVGRWHHGQGHLVNGSIRIARWDCDTNPPTEFRERMLQWICDTLNAAAIRAGACPPAERAERKLVELNWPPEASSPQPMYYVAHPDGSFSIATPQPILRAPVQPIPEARAESPMQGIGVHLTEAGDKTVQLGAHHLTPESIAAISHRGRASMATDPLTPDTGDIVSHGPTGEEWVVAYVRDDKLAACGWPDTIADLADCTLVSKATPEERRSLLETMAAGNGHRASYAQRALGWPCNLRQPVERPAAQGEAT
jgi:hypothetical protein